MTRGAEARSTPGRRTLRAAHPDEPLRCSAFWIYANPSGDSVLLESPPEFGQSAPAGRSDAAV